jgi:hypothetical protein
MAVIRAVNGTTATLYGWRTLRSIEGLAALSDLAGGCSGHLGIRRHVTCDNRANGNDRAVPDGYARKYDDIVEQHDIVANGDRSRDGGRAKNRHVAVRDVMGVSE